MLTIVNTASSSEVVPPSADTTSDDESSETRPMTRLSAGASVVA
ncbi:hypothetical protein [Pseudonocardia xishanensis]